MRESYKVECERDDLKLKLNKSNDEKHRLQQLYDEVVRKRDYLSNQA